MPTGPATISAEARALIVQALAQPREDMTAPVAQLRAESRASCAPGSEAVVQETGVTLSEREIAGTPCMVIDPPDPRPGCRIVYLFGGGFMLGSPFEDLPISATLAARTGAQLIAPSYPLASEHPFPAALDACTAVTRAVLAEKPATCLAGESAGGNLALAVTHCLRRSGAAVPRALALMSPAVDLDDVGDSGAADRDPFLVGENTHHFHAAYVPAGTSLRDPDISPIYGAFDATFPPVFTTTGTRDYLLSGCVRLDRTLRTAGARTELRVWEGMWHVFEYYPDIPEAGASLAELADFLSGQFD